MRYTFAAAALSLVAVLTASTGQAAPEPLDPRAAALALAGHAALAASDADSAVADFEAALTIQPGALPIYLDLADATRRQGLQGKALRYYRAALAVDPTNLVAISGEGVALVEKGAVAKAQRNLARLQGLCGDSCEPTSTLAAAIARGPAPVVVTAADVTPKPVASEN